MKLQTPLATFMAFGLLAFRTDAATTTIKANVNVSLTNIIAADGRSDASRESLLFASQRGSKTTLIIDMRDHVIGTMPAPLGFVALDSRGNFYDIPDYSDELRIFAPPYSRVTTTLKYGLNNAWGVAVDARSGVFAVIIEQYEDGGPGPYFVYLYAPGTTKPCAKIPSPSVQLAGGAFDRNGTLYMIAITGAGAGVASISDGCRAKAAIFNTLPAEANGGPNTYLDFDNDDNLVFQNGGIIFAFAHPVNQQYGDPVHRTILLPRNSLTTMMCLTRDRKHLLATPNIGDDPSGLLSEYRYPEGGMPIRTIPIKNVESAIEKPPASGSTDFMARGPAEAKSP